MDNQTIINQIIANWKRQVEQAFSVIDKIPDNHFKKDIAPNRNSGSYLVAHLIATNENILSLLELGDKKYPEFAEPFARTPDKGGQPIYEPQILRDRLKEVTEHLTERFSRMSTEDWFARHTAVSAEDFAKDQSRNKLNILLTRTTHLAYHTGQLLLLTDK